MDDALPRARNAVALAARVIVCAAVGAFLVVKIGDSDTWWHVRTGQWIWDHRAIPRVDPFSHTAPGPWRYTEAFAQLLYYGAYAAGGVIGLQLLHAGLGAATAAVTASIRRRATGPTLVALALGAAAGLAATSVKPQMYTYLGFALTLFVLARVDANRTRAWPWLVPVFFLWASSHRGGLVGLFAVCAALVAWALDPTKRHLLRSGVPMLGACALLLLTSSGGAFYYSSAFDVAAAGRFSSSIVEWQPLTWTLLVERHLALVVLVPLAAVGLWARRRITFELLVVAGTLLLAARGARLVPLLAIASVQPAAEGIEWLLKRRAHAGDLDDRSRTVGYAVLAIAILASNYARSIPPYYAGFGVFERRVPVALASFLARHPPPGRMWHSFDLGGYLLFALAPDQRVFIDGRNDTVYPHDFFEETLRAPVDEGALSRQLARHDVTYAALTAADAAPGRSLPVLASGEFVACYLDDVGSVWVRRSPETSAYVRELGLPELHPWTVEGRLIEFDDGPEDAAFADDVLENARRAPRSLKAQYYAAWILRVRGDSRYEETWRRVVSISESLFVPPPEPPAPRPSGRAASQGSSAR